MSSSRSHKQPNPVTTIFSFFLYSSILLQWMWTLLVFLPTITETDFFKNYIQPSNTPIEPQVVAPAIPQQFDIVFVILAVIITFALVIATIIAIIRLPATVAKKPKAAIQQAAAQTAPFVARHISHKKTDTLHLTKQMVTLFHHLLILLPLALLLCAFFTTTTLSVAVIFAVGAFFAFWSYVWYIATLLVDSKVASKKKRTPKSPSSSKKTT